MHLRDLRAEAAAVRAPTALIPDGHKYACLALTTGLVSPDLPSLVSVREGLVVLRHPPVSLTGTWQEWLGTIEAADLARADLFLVAHAPSVAPAVLDDENRRLAEIVHRFYYALLIATPFVAHHHGRMLTGAAHGRVTDIREVQLLRTHSTGGRQSVPVDSRRSSSRSRRNQSGDRGAAG